LDINVRRSVILGFVGAGGIGFELQRVLGQLAYQRAFTIVAIIFVFVIALERLSAWVRRTLIDGSVESNGRARRSTTMKAVAVSVATVGFVAASLAVRVTPASIGNSVSGMARVAGRVYTPDFATNCEAILTAPQATASSALAATVMWMATALPISLPVALHTSPRTWVPSLGRAFMVVQRGVPELVLAVVFAVAVGL